MKNFDIFTNPATGNAALYIISRDGHKVVDLCEIILCKADRNYTKILLQEKIIDVSKSLCILENALKDYNFCRCNPSYLINLRNGGTFHRYYH